MPLGRGVLGSGATLNNPLTKRNGKNTVTIKAGLDTMHVMSANIVGSNTQTAIESSGVMRHRETPGDERESQAQTPPRNENALSPMGGGGTSSKNYQTKLPKI